MSRDLEEAREEGSQVVICGRMFWKGNSLCRALWSSREVSVGVAEEGERKSHIKTL